MVMSYQTGKNLANFVFGVLCREDIQGTENIPKTGPVIIAANHIATPEIFLLVAKVDRKVNYLAKKELLLGGNIIKDYVRDQVIEWGVIPVDRGKRDIGALIKCIEVIKEGKALAIFPEGTRSKDGNLKEFKPGLAYIVEKLHEEGIDVPVIPAGVIGTKELESPKILIPKLLGYSIHYGNPIYYKDYKSESKKMSKSAFTNGLRDKIQYLINNK